MLKINAREFQKFYNKYFYETIHSYCVYASLKIAGVTLRLKKLPPD